MQQSKHPTGTTPVKGPWSWVMALLMFVWGLLGLLFLVPPDGPRSWPVVIVLGLPLLVSGTFFSVRAVLSHARVTRAAVVYVGFTRTSRTALDQIDRALVVDVGGSAEEF